MNSDDTASDKTDISPLPQADPVVAIFTPSYRGNSVVVERPRRPATPAPKPDPLTELREWVDANTIGRPFESTFVDAADLLAKIKELEQR